MDQVKRISLSGYEHLVEKKIKEEEEKYKASFVFLKKGDV